MRQEGSMKNSTDTIGNRTRDLPACSAVPQPTAPPCAPKRLSVGYRYSGTKTVIAFGPKFQGNSEIGFQQSHKSNETPMTKCRQKKGKFGKLRCNVASFGRW